MEVSVGSLSGEQTLAMMRTEVSLEWIERRGRYGSAVRNERRTWYGAVPVWAGYAAMSAGPGL